MLRALLLPWLLLASLASGLVAQTIDAQIGAGDRFAGSLDDPLDVDVVRLQAVAGVELTLSVTAKPDKGAPKLLPSVEVLDVAGGQVLLVLATGKSKVAAKKLLLPTSGAYDIRIGSADAESAGPYELKTKGKLGKAAKKADGVDLVATGDVLSDVFEAGAGWSVSVRVQPDKGSPALPEAPTLHGPSGPLDLSAVLASKPKGKHVIKPFLLDEAGTYTLRTRNLGEDGAIRVKRKLKAPKVKASTLAEPTAPGGLSAARLLQLSVRAPDGAALPGVALQIEDEVVALSDTEGFIMLSAVPAGQLVVRLDGEAGDLVGDLAAIATRLDVAPVGETVRAGLVLPDLTSVDSASDEVALDLDGAAVQPILALGADPDVGLAGPAGTAILLGDAPAQGSVTVALTPVAALQAHGRLEAAAGPVDVGAYAFLSPLDARFDTGGGGAAHGLDLRLPNVRGLPVGTQLDIWAFDVSAGGWVDRSAQTGARGLVVESGFGTRIEASGVCLSGGLHAAVVAVDEACATEVTGRLVDEALQPVSGAWVATSLGGSTVTGPDGRFSLESVPAYDVDQLPACVAPPEDLVVEFVAPPGAGSAVVSVPVSVGQIVHGGVTDLGDVELVVSGLGGVAGQLLDNGAPVVGGVVAIVGIDEVDVTSGATGSFFANGLTPGAYTASHTFSGDDEPTVVSFDVLPDEITSIVIQRLVFGGGGGGDDLTVRVLCDVTGQFATGNSFEPVAGAQVSVRCFDTTLNGVTNDDGEATFEDVSGACDVTAVADLMVEEFFTTYSLRIAATVFAVDTDDTEGVVSVPLMPQSVFVIPEGATVSGAVANLPAGLGGANGVLVRDGDGQSWSSHFVHPQTGEYSAPIAPGKTFHVVYVHWDASGDATTMALALEQGPVAPGGTLVLDFDAQGPGAIPFDRLVTLSHAGGLGAPATTDYSVVLWPPSGEPFSVTDPGDPSDATLLGQVQVPDANLVALGGARLSLNHVQHVQQGAGPAVACNVFLDGNPVTIDYVMPVLMQVTSPADGSEFTVAEALGLQVEWDDMIEPDWQGWTTVDLYGDDVGESDLGVDRVRWTGYVRAGEDEVQMPALPADLFAPGLEYEIDIEARDVREHEVDFDLLFGVDFVERYTGLYAEIAEECATIGGVEFTTQAEP